jgi:hypothetical protein
MDIIYLHTLTTFFVMCVFRVQGMLLVTVHIEKAEINFFFLFFY